MARITSGLLLCLLVASSAHAQEVAQTRPLSLGDVLESLDRHPQLVAAAVRVDGAEGAVLTAEGAFDLSLSARGSVMPAGYYNYGRADASLVQPTGLWGTSFFAGWRIGRGWDNGIPDYYGYEETLNRGEVRAGATVPLWQNGPIDARRAGVRRAEANRDATAHELRSRKLRLAVVASEAYVRWLAAAKKSLIAAELLRIAEERDAQIRSRVQAGAIPAIEELENQRVMLERRAALVATVRQVERAAIALSLFLRRSDGAPLLVGPDRAPADFDFHPWLAVDPDLPRATALAWKERPELARLGPIAEAAQVTRELAENQVSPRLDLTLQGSLDVGRGATTPEARDRLGTPAFEGALTLAIPLQLREARGRVDTASAELRQIEMEVELARNTIEAEVRDAVSAFLNARTTLDLASDSARVAAEVRDAERSRFENGLGTLLMVNLREAAAAQAQAVFVDATPISRFPTQCLAPPLGLCRSNARGRLRRRRRCYEYEVNENGGLAEFDIHGLPLPRDRVSIKLARVIPAAPKRSPIATVSSSSFSRRLSVGSANNSC